MAKGARIAGLHRAAYGRKPAGLSVANMAIEGCGKICPPTQSNSRNCHVCREIKNRLYANRRGAALGDLCFSAHCSCLYSAGGHRNRGSGHFGGGPRSGRAARPKPAKPEVQQRLATAKPSPRLSTSRRPRVRCSTGSTRTSKAEVRSPNSGSTSWKTHGLVKSCSWASSDLSCGASRRC